MLNKLWPIFIIISVIYAILMGNVDQINEAVFESCKQAVDLSITLFGTMCLWNGIMQIASNTSFIKKITKLLTPFMKFLFPDISPEEKEYQEISMNIVANMFGLGNAATPLGLKAMKSLQEKNKDKETLTNSMAMFIILNTASIQIIPTTVIAIRNSLGTNNPTGFIVPVWISSICALTAGVISAKLFMKKNKK